MKVLNFEHGECKKIRTYLDSYINNELLVETNHEVLKHLESCQDCAASLDARLRVKRALQTAVKKEVAPLSLQYRIQREIRKTGATPSYNWRTWMIAAAAMVVVAFGSWGVFKAIQSRNAATKEAFIRQDVEVLNVGLGDHMHCAIDRGFADKRFTDEEMSAKLGTEFYGLVALVKDKVQGRYEVVAGHRCKFKQREFIHLTLRNQDKVMSLVLTKKNGEAFAKATLGKVLQASDVTVHTDRLQNYEVAGFETRDYLAFVVSNLDSQESDQVAASLAPALRDYLAKLES
jgi:hypothetical protein